MGPNEVATSGVPPWWRLLASSLLHPFNLILCFLAAIAALTADWATAAIMLTMVLISTGLRFWQVGCCTGLGWGTHYPFLLHNIARP